MTLPDDVVYLDFAATSARRPGEVVEAVSRYLTEVGATPGRAGHRLARDAGRVALECRQALAALFGVPGDAGRIAFTFNATHALNVALAGTLRRGDVVVRTALDHNAVRRPLVRLARERGVEVRVVPATRDGALDRGALVRMLRGARLLVVNHASNVLGTVLDVADLAERAHAAGALVLVDAAQTAGHVAIDVGAQGIDLLAFTGHKGLLGPQGTGGLWVREGVEVEPLLAGGSGGDSLLADMPAAWPDHLEAGTLNAPGIAGLASGVAWLRREGVERIRARTSSLHRALADGLAAIEGLDVLSPLSAQSVPIVTIASPQLRADRLADRLDREHGVLVRAGLHCAPDVHRLIGTAETGAVRFSLGWSTTESDVARALEAVARTLRAASRSGPPVSAGAIGGDGPDDESRIS